MTPASPRIHTATHTRNTCICFPSCLLPRFAPFHTLNPGLFLFPAPSTTIIVSAPFPSLLRLCSQRGVTMETGYNWWSWNVTIGIQLASARTRQSWMHADTHMLSIHYYVRHSGMLHTIMDVQTCVQKNIQCITATFQRQKAPFQELISLNKCILTWRVRMGKVKMTTLFTNQTWLLHLHKVYLHVFDMLLRFVFLIPKIKEPMCLLLCPRICQTCSHLCFYLTADRLYRQKPVTVTQMLSHFYKNPSLLSVTRKKINDVHYFLQSLTLYLSIMCKLLSKTNHKKRPLKCVYP